MPPTATPRSSARQHAARNSRLRQSTESQIAPVLFRLPEIELASLITPAEGTDETHIPTSGEEVSTAEGQHERVLETKAPADARPTDGDTRYSPESMSVPGRYSLDQAASPSASVAYPAASAQPSLGRRQAGPEKMGLAMNTVQEDRSWWEHWSSGVVLILLVIALVAASIMALSDTNQEQSQDLAGTEDEFSLDGLVHDLEGLDAAVMDDAVSESPQPAHGSSTKSNLMHSSVQGPQLADGQASGSAVVPQSSSPDDPRNQPPIDGLSADALPATAPVASSEADRSSATPGATAQASKSQNFQSGSPSSSIQNTGESLMVQVPESHLTQESVTKPSVSLSTPRPAEQAQPSTEQMMSHARNDQSIGLQPAGSAETSPLQQSTLAASAQQQSSVQLPAYQTPAGGVPHSTAEHSSGSHRLTTVSHRTPVDAPPESNSTPTAAAEQTQGGPMVKSATPEMDAEALIRAYQEFRQLNQVGAQTSNGHTSNSQN